MTTTNLGCYSDHAHDVIEKGACDICGSTRTDEIGTVLPHLERITGDPVNVARKVLHERAAKVVDGVLLDATTASAIDAVAKALSPPALVKLRAMDLPRAAIVCWRLVARQSGAT